MLIVNSSSLFSRFPCALLLLPHFSLNFTTQLRSILEKFISILYITACMKEASMADLYNHRHISAQSDVVFTREANETNLLSFLFDKLYSCRVEHYSVNRMSSLLGKQMRQTFYHLSLTSCIHVEWNMILLIK